MIPRRPDDESSTPDRGRERGLDRGLVRGPWPTIDHVRGVLPAPMSLPVPAGPYHHWLGAGPPAPGERLRSNGFADGVQRRAIGLICGTLHVRAEDPWDRWCDLWRSLGAHASVYGPPPRYPRAAQFLAAGGFVSAALRNARDRARRPRDGSPGDDRGQDAASDGISGSRKEIARTSLLKK